MVGPMGGREACRHVAACKLGLALHMLIFPPSTGSQPYMPSTGSIGLHTMQRANMPPKSHKDSLQQDLELWVN